MKNKDKKKSNFLKTVREWMPIIAFSVLAGIVVIVIIILFDKVPLVVSSVSEFFQDATKDGWLSFIGALIGGLLTMVGVLITIKYESSKARKERLQQSQPIILLQYWKGKDDEAKREIAEDLILSEDTFSNYEKSGKAEKAYENTVLPDIVLRNIGFNTALNIHYHMKIDAMNTSIDGIIEYMPVNDSTVIKIKVDVQWRSINKINGAGIITGKGLDSQLTNAAKNILDESKLKTTTSYVGLTGKLAIDYLDVLGNAYFQSYDVSFWLLTHYDSQCSAFLTFPNYTRKVQFTEKRKYDRLNEAAKKITENYGWKK